MRARLLIVALVVALAAAPVLAASPTITLDPFSGPTCGMPAFDVCTAGADLSTNFPTAPMLILPGGAAFGLLPGDVLTSFTFGFDSVTGVEPILFSVDPFSVGVVGFPPDVFSEAALGEAFGDIYFGGTTGVPAGANFLFVDGDGLPGAAPPALGLVEAPALPPLDNIDAMSTCDAFSPLTFGAPAFFTLAPGSPSLAAAGAAGPEDILMLPFGAPGPPVPAFPGATINLCPGDVIDALVFDTAGGLPLFSLAPGSPSAFFFGYSPADILAAAPFAPGFGPCGNSPLPVAFPAAALGLLFGDNIDALDMPLDADGDLVNDACDNCLALFNNDQTDTDSDLAGDPCDNCPSTSNPSQTDTDSDLAGDACDPCPTDPNDNCPTGACPATPLSGCLPPGGSGKSQLQIKDRVPAGPGPKDKVQWKWLKGPALTQADFADPNGLDPIDPNGPDYKLCVYTGSTPAVIVELQVPAGGTCGGKPCWKAISTKGYKYGDKTQTSDGVKKLILKGGAATKSKILIQAKDANVPLPTLPLDPNNPVIVQLSNTDPNLPCYGETYAPANVIKNTAEQFKAKLP